MASVNIFTERNKKLILAKKLEVSMGERIRKTICNIMAKYDQCDRYYDSICFQCKQEMEIYYDFEHVGKKETIKYNTLAEFLPNTYPSRTLDALEIFSQLCFDDDFIEEINMVFQNHELPYELTKGKANIINNIVIPNSLTADMEVAKKDIEANIIKKNFQAVIDRLHTYYEYFIQAKLEQKNIAVQKDNNNNILLSKAAKEYKIWLKNNDKIDQFQENAIQYAGNLMDSYNGIRNNKSMAHSKSLLDNDSAEFLTKIVAAVLTLLDKVDK